jgi:hypothetical protein
MGASGACGPVCTHHCTALRAWSPELCCWASHCAQDALHIPAGAIGWVCRLIIMQACCHVGSNLPCCLRAAHVRVELKIWLVRGLLLAVCLLPSSLLWSLQCGEQLAEPPSALC